MRLLTPHHPVGGEPLTADTPHSLAGGGDRFPVCAGIPYLRAGRDEVRDESLRLLDAGDEDGGLAVLLTDQDPFAPLPPPTVAECRSLVADVRADRCKLREAMERLKFGPVADYFAVRCCTPTFLSGLGLLSQCGGRLPVVEVACGVGQLLREPKRRCETVAGIDLVFSKLWLARRFVLGDDVPLACADLGSRAVEPTTAVTVLCHDAFYFVPDKPAGAAALKRLAGAGGRVLVGHAHVAGGDNGGVAGNLLTAAGYADLFPRCVTFDDAAFTQGHLTGEHVEPDYPEAIEAVSLAWRAEGEITAFHQPDAYADPFEGTRLVVNPLLAEDGGRLTPRWPTPKFAAEYAGADYLTGEAAPFDEVMRAAAGGLYEYARDCGTVSAAAWTEGRRLARRRILVPAGDVV